MHLFGHIQVFEWFKNSGYEFKYNKYTIKSACYFQDTKVLEWFKNSGYEFKYDEDLIVSTSIDGHLQVLEWFKNSGYEFKYNRGAFTTKFIKILKFYSYHFNIKKLIKWSNEIIFIKTIKFKTYNKYLKGYRKN